MRRCSFKLPKDVLFFFSAEKSEYAAFALVDNCRSPARLLLDGRFDPPIPATMPLKGRRHLSKMPAEDISALRKRFTLVLLDGRVLSLEDLAKTMEMECPLAALNWREHSAQFRYLAEGNELPWEAHKPQNASHSTNGAEKPPLSAIEETIQKCSTAISSHNDTEAESLLVDLKAKLQIVKGKQKRKRFGGWEYSPHFVLQTVLLADEVRDISRLRHAVIASLKLVLSSELSEHSCSQDLTAPSKNTVLRSRISVDLASMIHCRDHLLPEHGGFVAHLRIDASPQFCREYFVIELDVLLHSDFDINKSLFETAQSCKVRLLPLQQLGTKAASTMHKLHCLTSALRLESASLPTTCANIYSILTDMGVEKSLWVAPQVVSQDSGDSDQEPELTYVFARHLPLADTDHALHHVAWIEKQQASLFIQSFCLLHLQCVFARC